MTTAIHPAIARAAAAIRSQRARATTGAANDVAPISLSDFKRRMYRPYIHTNYQALLDAKLAQVERYVATGGAEGIGRLMIFMPPRHGKSMTVSKLFPAWFIGRNPDKRMIMASYGATLAQRNSRFVRNMVKTDRYHELFSDVALAQDTASAAEWDIAGHEGGAIAAGIGGGITGHGAHLLIIDDPFKSRAEAESPTYRENIKEWYGDAYTRLEEPGGAVILMHTRWHEDDLAGYLLNESTDHWEVLNLPAEALDDDPLGREPGAALWPERYGLDKLVKIAETLGEYRYGAEYQQSPKPKSGGLFDAQLIKVVDVAPDCKRVVRFYDLAVTKKKTSDYTVGLLLGITEDEAPVILHVWREQKTAPEVQDAIAQNAKTDGPKVRIRLEAEKAGIIALDYLLRDPRMRGYSIDAIPPDGDKYTRAGPIAARVRGQRVMIVRGDWNRTFLDELSMFPNAAHDDQVDALSGAWAMMSENRKYGGIHV